MCKVVPIIKRKNDFNSDLGSYLDKRRGTSSTSFFKKVDAMIPKKKQRDSVPNVSMTSATVYGEEKKSFWSSLVTRKARRTSDVLEEEIEEANIPVKSKQELHDVAEEIDDIEAAEDELEVRRQGLLARFFANLFSSKQNKNSTDDFDEDLQEVNTGVAVDDARLLKEQTAQVLKSLHRWLSKLPPEQIDAFRRSPEFEDYKDLLNKYGLVK